MEIPQPTPNSPDIYSYGFDKNLNKTISQNIGGYAETDITNPGIMPDIYQGQITTLEGSVIDGQYVDELGVGKLTAGIISSKAISLGITAGTGDCYISGGAGLDYTNWTADKGFILGLDDSDSDLAKFFIGDNANNKYFKFDGANADSTGFRYIEVFTAGETLTTDKVVCLKPSYSDYVATHDAEVYEAAPTTNYGSDTTFETGQDGSSKTWLSYIKFDFSLIPAAEAIIKAELRIKTQSIKGATNINIVRATADWDESTITWDTKSAVAPTSTELETQFGCEYVKASGGSTEVWIVYDITQFVRHWKAGNVANYGFQISGGGAGAGVHFYSSEASNTANRPVLRIYSDNDCDGKLYKANCSDPLLCRSIVGITIEGADADSQVKIQTQGQYTNSSFGSTISGRFYLNSTAGTYVTNTINLNRVIRLGKITSSASAILNIQDENILIDKNISLMSMIVGGGAISNDRIYAPNSARYAIIDYLTTVADTIRSTVIVYRDADGFKTSYNGNLTSGASEFGISATWTGSYILLANTGSAGDITIKNIYFYT